MFCLREVCGFLIFTDNEVSRPLLKQMEIINAIVWLTKNLAPFVTSRDSSNVKDHVRKTCSWKVLMPFIQYNPIKGLSIQSLQHNTQTELNVRNILEVSIVYWSLKALAHKRVQNRNPVIYLWIRHWPIRKAFFC